MYYAMNKAELRTLVICSIIGFIVLIGVWYAANFECFNDAEGIAYFIMCGMLILLGGKSIQYLIYNE